MRSPRISVAFDNESMKQLKLISDKTGKSISEIVSGYTLEGLKGQINADNIDLVTKIIRTQLKDVMQPSIDRICSLLAKTCVSSAQSSILTAETIAKFVPLDQQAEFKDTYEKARLKAIEYTKTKVNDLID